MDTLILAGALYGLVHLVLNLATVTRIVTCEFQEDRADTSVAGILTGITMVSYYAVVYSILSTYNGYRHGGILFPYFEEEA